MASVEATPPPAPSTPLAKSPSPYFPPTHPAQTDIPPTLQSPNQTACTRPHTPPSPSPPRYPAEHADAPQSRCCHAPPSHQPPRPQPASASPTPPCPPTRSASHRSPQANRKRPQPHQYPTPRHRDSQTPSRCTPPHPSPPYTPASPPSPAPPATPPASDSDSASKTPARSNTETPASARSPSSPPAPPPSHSRQSP